MKLFGVWVLGSLAITAWLIVNVGIVAGLLALAWLVFGAGASMGLAWWDVRTDGYVLQKKDDPESGRRRWWVGTPREDGTVRWHMPGPGTR